MKLKITEEARQKVIDHLGQQNPLGEWFKLRFTRTGDNSFNLVFSGEDGDVWHLGEHHFRNLGDTLTLDFMEVRVELKLDP